MGDENLCLTAFRTFWTRPRDKNSNEIWNFSTFVCFNFHALKFFLLFGWNSICKSHQPVMKPNKIKLEFAFFLVLLIQSELNWEKWGKEEEILCCCIGKLLNDGAENVFFSTLRDPLLFQALSKTTKLFLINHQNRRKRVVGVWNCM